jgi:hypothetical protein
MRLAVVKLRPLRELVVGAKKGGVAFSHPIEALIARFFFHHNAQQSPGRADHPRPVETKRKWTHVRTHVDPGRAPRRHPHLRETP